MNCNYKNEKIYNYRTQLQSEFGLIQEDSENISLHYCMKPAITQ